VDPPAVPGCEDLFDAGRSTLVVRSDDVFREIHGRLLRLEHCVRYGMQDAQRHHNQLREHQTLMLLAHTQLHERCQLLQEKVNVLSSRLEAYHAKVLTVVTDIQECQSRIVSVHSQIHGIQAQISDVTDKLAEAMARSAEEEPVRVLFRSGS
jgi:uncharacterized coiled-coil DUF342 family protein